MQFLGEVSYKEFLILKDQCFPDESIDEISYINNISRGNFIFIKTGKVQGYALIKTVGDTAQLIHLCVALNSRGKGLGRRLLDKAIWKVQQRGCRIIRLNVDIINQGAVRFYRNYGFKVNSLLFRYTLNVTVLNNMRSDVELHIVTQHNRGGLQRYSQLGEDTIIYCLNSRQTNIYLIYDQNLILRGYLIFELQTFNIPEIYLEHPSLIGGVITRLNQIVDLDRFLHISFTNDGLEKYLEQIELARLDYELLEMIYAF